MRAKIYFLAFISILFLESCATVINTTTQNVEIKTNPPNAKITIDGKKFGTTPQSVNLERGSNHVIKLELDGYDTYETQITRKISIWFWGNAFNGFLPGMIVDMFTGSMYNLLPESINVELQQAKAEPAKKK
ncbi:MAG: PEGA domain-containing protein [Melioribacter sp.]|uniref:PEGA domain-containing protein n=1 Tax=Rosettibacter primus TaxID=3111523 RepID=UPI00247EB75D|nr:PEGA domain-containing protein [Melioribacter sp.]